MDDQIKPEISSTQIGNMSVSYRNRAEYLTIKNEIFTEKCYQPVGSKPLSKPVIVDIGSHIGLSLMYFKDQFPDATIYAYEPVPQLFDLLEINVLSNNFRDITLVNAAVTTKSGTTTLNLSHDKDFWFANTSMYLNSWSGRVDTEQVEVDSISIDEVIEPHKNIDLLKIDVEGYELKLLENIDHSKIEYLMVEYHPINKNRFKNVEKLLNKNYSSVKYHFEGALNDTPPETDELFIIHAF